MPESPQPIKLVHQADRWVIPIQGWWVTQIRIDRYLGLVFGGITADTLYFEIDGRFRFRNGTETYEPEAGPHPFTTLAPVLAVFEKELLSATAYESGALELTFRDDMEVFVPPDPIYEAWHADASNNPFVLVSPRGGGVRAGTEPVIRLHVNDEEVYRMLGKLDEALAECTKAIELDPKMSPAYINRGNIHREKGNLEQAIADYTKAVELDPNFVNIYHIRGVAYNQIGDLDQAIGDFTKAIDLIEYKWAYYSRGLAFRRKGLYPEAAEDFAAYLRLNPNAANRVEVEQWIRELKQSDQ